VRHLDFDFYTKMLRFGLTHSPKIGECSEQG